MKYDWSKNRLEEAVKGSASYSEILDFLGIPKRGGNLNTLKFKINEYNIDTKHLTHEKRINKGGSIPIDDYFVGSRYITSSKLKYKLFSCGMKEERCEMCGINEWNGKKIVLQLHHINGNHSDNSLDNLQILCPNCHSQTETYCNTKREEKEKNKCVLCGKEITKKATMCFSCFSKARKSKPTKYSKDELMDFFIQYGSFVEIGKFLGVSDNSVRKYFDNVNLPIHSNEVIKLIKQERGENVVIAKNKKFSGFRRCSEQRRKKVKQFDLNGVFIKEYNSIKETQDYGFNKKHVSSCCNGKLKTHKKFIWKFSE